MATRSPFRVSNDKVRPVPFRQIVNQWRLVSVLDMILCQLFGDDSRSAFFSSLLAIARMRLPRYVIEDLLGSKVSKVRLGGQDMEVCGGAR